MRPLSQEIINQAFNSEFSSRLELHLTCQLKKALSDLEEEYIRIAKLKNQEEENFKVSEEKPDLLNNISFLGFNEDNRIIKITNNFNSKDFYQVFNEGVIPNRIYMYTNFTVIEE